MNTFICQQKISILDWMNKSIFATCDSDENIVTIWDIDSDKPKKTFKAHDLVITSMQFDSSGTYLATSSEDIKIWTLDSDSPYRVFSEHKSKINCIQWSKSSS